MKYFLALLCVSAAIGQQAAGSGGIVQGVVRDAATGLPLDGAVVRYVRTEDPIEVKTDTLGRFRILDVNPGEVRISVFPRGNTSGVAPLPRTLVLAERQTVEMDIAVATLGEISGTVEDEERGPVPNAQVWLVAREIANGELRHVLRLRARTNAVGQYHFANVETARSFLLLATLPRQPGWSFSQTPADLDSRESILEPAFYPSASFREGALAVRLGPNEHRERVDIRMRRGPNLCVSGQVSPVAGEPLRVDIMNLAAQQGRIRSIITIVNFSLTPEGEFAQPDRRFRICDLSAGSYRLQAYSDVPAATGNGPPAIPDFHGQLDFTLIDRDLTNLTLTAAPRITVAGEVIWKTEQDARAGGEVTVRLAPLGRMVRTGESVSATVPAPGRFVLPNLLLGDYVVEIPRTGQHYVEDVTYGGRSIKNSTLPAGARSDSATLRIVLATDGGSVQARVTDRRGKPLAGAYVVVLPYSATRIEELAASITGSLTSESGEARIGMLPPGRYVALASLSAPDYSPESLQGLLAARGRGTELTIGRGAVSLSLTPTVLE